MTVTWMDGREEKHDFTHWETKEGVLHIWTEYTGSMQYGKRYNDMSFPLVNIRSYKAGDRT